MRHFDPHYYAYSIVCVHSGTISRVRNSCSHFNTELLYIHNIQQVYTQGSESLVPL